MFNSGPSGFQHAPVSKGLMLLTAGASVLVTMMNARDRFNLPSLGLLTQKMQLWRLFTNHLFFSSAGEALFGMILMYYFRLFERQMGSSKFGAFTLISIAISSLLQLGVLSFFPSRSIVSGPYSLIFASLVLFHYTVPVTNRFQIFRVSFNDKLFTYLLGFQLLFSHSWSSFLTGMCGVVSGLLYTGDVVRLRQLKLPAWLTRICNSLFLPLLQSPSGPSVARRSVGARSGSVRMETSPLLRSARYRPARTPGGGFFAGETPGNVQVSVPVSEDNVGALTSMGFPREIALQALQQSNNDLQHATNLLLDSS